MEGSATHQCLAQLPPGADLARASFYVGDACDVLATPSLDTSLSEQEARPSPLVPVFTPLYDEKGY